MSLEYNVTTGQNGARFSYTGGGGCLLIFAGLVGLGIWGYEYIQFYGVWPGWGEARRAGLCAARYRVYFYNIGPIVLFQRHG